MDLLLSFDVYKAYLTSYSKYPKSEIEQSLQLLFNNEKNRFIISKYLVELIKESLKNDPAASAFFEPFIAHLINNNSINVAAKDLQNNKSAMMSMESGYNALNAQIKRDLYLKVSTNQTNSIGGDNCVIIEHISKPNIHWLLFNLICKHPSSVTIRYFDFKSNEEIKNLIDGILKATNLLKVDIYDRQVNLSHNYFDVFRSQVTTEYYTTFNKKNALDQIEKIKDLKSHFKKIRIHKGENKDIHERRLVIGYLILESDDDFWNLLYDRNTWKIDVIYCQNTVLSISKKKAKFKQVN